ncbi:MAG TPA: cellulase family glycosylhydrolase [Amaricoccus sp.]|nr:cellulase family glycosylhydrolase [Amaricoccus sp.]
MIRGWLAAVAVALALAGTAGAGRASGDVSVEGNRFLRDGRPWVAEGVTLVGLVSPERRVRDKPTYAAARAAFGDDMLAEVRRFGADTVRFQVSQAGLDPRSPIHDPDYRQEVLDGIALTRAAGFNVIISMQWQGVSGKRDPTGLPSATTRRAWREIAPAFAEDRGILLEVFNEPAIRHSTPRDWGKWAEGVQPLIDTLRAAGSKNVLLLGGVQFSRSFYGAPELTDPLGQLGYAVHPFLDRHNLTREQWEKRFGDWAETHPVMATAFNANAGGNYCRPEMAGQAEALLDYLAEERIGLVAWALDMPNLREADGSYTTLDDLVCGKRREGGRGGAGQMIHEHFLAH